ncbi:translocation/assembly module TamB domain-containing protein [Stella sp.]|uniref:translocation/assembly module TamB domain-containing protein n=1 Tax=Stella sp. TaxID=2912054 RepID=UPI0035ADC338
MWWLRRTFGVAAIVLLLLLVVLGGLFAAAQTRLGRDWLAGAIADAASAPGSRVAIAGIAGLVPFAMTVRELSVADEAGPWLAIDRLEIDWFASDILSRRLRLGLMAAQRIRLDRLPVLPPSASPAGPPGPPGLPHLPLTLSLDRIAVERLEIAPAVAGEAIAIAVHGAATLESSRAEATVAVRRLDGPEGAIDLRLVFAPDENRLEAKLDATDPSGDLARRLLGGDEPRPARLSLDGAGPIDGWTGRLTGSLGEGASLDLVLQARGIAPYRLAVDGTIRPAPLLAEPWRAPLADGIRMSGHATGADDATIARLDVSGGGLALSASGRLAPDGAVAGRVDATVVDLAPLGAAAGQNLSGALVLGADLTGTTAAPRLALTIDGTGLAAAAAGLDGLSLSADVRPAGDAVALSARGRVSGLSLDGAPAPVRDADWTVAGTLAADGRMAIDGLTVTTADGMVAAAGTVAPDGPLDLRLSAELPAALLRRVGSPLHGAVALSGRIAGDMRTGALSGDATAEMHAPEGEPTLTALLGPAPRLAAEFRRAADGGLRAPSLRLEGREIRIEASGSLGRDGAVAAEMRAVLPRLAALAQPLGTAMAGEVAAEATVSGTLDRPAAAVRLSSAELTAAGRRIRRLAVSADGRLEGTRLTGRVEGGLDLDGVPVTLRADLRREADRLAVEDLRVDAAGQRLTGSATLGGGGPVAAAARVAAPDLSRLEPLLGRGAAGGLDLTARLGPVGRTLRLSADGNARDLAIADARVRAATIKVSVDAPMTAPRGTVAVQARGIAAGGRAIDEAKLDASGDLAREIRATLAARGQRPQPLAVDLAATIGRAGEAIAATLTRGSVTVDQQTIALGGPLRIGFDRGTVTADGIDLRLAGGRVTGRARYAADGIDGELALARLSMAELGRLAGVRGMQGQIDGEARIDTAARQPSGTLSLRAGGIRWRGTPRDLPPLAIVADGSWQDGRASLTAALRDVPDAALTVAASVPLVLAAKPAQFALPPDGTIGGRADGNVDLARLRTYLPTETLTMAGRLDAALRLDGTVAAPRPGGRASLAGARIEDGGTGIVLADLEATLVGDGDRFRLEKLSATDGAGGRIAGQGFAERRDAGWGGEAAVTAERFRVLANDLGRAIASGRIEARSTAAGQRIAGRVQVDQGDIALPQSTPAALTPLPVVEINRPGVADADPSGGTAAALPIALAIDVVLPGRLFVRGRGLDSEWRGNLRVAGTLDAPQVTGAIETVRGRYDLLGRRFTVERGVISFDGAPTDARLDLLATATANQLKATVTVAGSATQPTLTLGSDPPLPQDEVLAQVLFGRSTSQVTPGQAVQLAQAAAELAGLGSGSGIVDRVRQTLGLDALDIGGEDGTSVTLGRYVTDDVFVKVNPNPGENASAVGVEIQVLPNVTVDAGVGGDGTSVGIKYRLDY